MSSDLSQLKLYLGFVRTKNLIAVTTRWRRATCFTLSTFLAVRQLFFHGKSGCCTCKAVCTCWRALFMIRKGRTFEGDFRMHTVQPPPKAFCFSQTVEVQDSFKTRLEELSATKNFRRSFIKIYLKYSDFLLHAENYKSAKSFAQFNFFLQLIFLKHFAI